MDAVVTSFSPDGWESYGRRFVEGYKKLWPVEVTLLVYVEDNTLLDVPGPRNVLWVDLSADPRFQSFVETYRHDRTAQGRVVDEPRRWKDRARRAGYYFRYDAYKFGRKTFAVRAAAEAVEEGRLFWLDADTVPYREPPTWLLDRMLPPPAPLSYLGRGWPRYHSECGFLGFRLPEALPLIVAWNEAYRTGTFKQFKEWHDSWVFDEVLHRSSFRDRAADLGRNLPRPRTFNLSPLGTCLHHLKGDLKWNLQGQRELARLESSSASRPS